MRPGTADDVPPLILGTWSLCDGPAALGAGILFDASGTFYGLISDGKGGLIKDPAKQFQGAWQVVAFGANGPGTFELNLAGDGILVLDPEMFSSSQTRMHLPTIDGSPASDYVRISAP